MMQKVNENQSDFWKGIGRVGIGQAKENGIPFEVVLNYGTISSDKQDGFEKWSGMEFWV